MKSSFLVVSLFSLVASHSYAQMGGGLRPGPQPLPVDHALGANPSTPGSWVCFSLTQATANLQQVYARSITVGSVRVDLNSPLVSALNSEAQQLCTVLSRPIVSGVATQNQLAIVDRDGLQILNVLATNRNPQVTQAAYEVAKAIGAMKLILDPNFVGSNTTPAPVVVAPATPVFQATPNAGKCAIRFKNSWDSEFLTSAQGADVSDAAGALYQACNSIGGSVGNITNAALCQSVIAQAKCINVDEEASRVTQNVTRFTACSLNFKNSWDSSFTVNGSGSSAGAALNNLWDNCKNTGGSVGNIENAQLCRENMVNRKFTCTTI